MKSSVMRRPLLSLLVVACVQDAAARSRQQSKPAFTRRANSILE